MVVRLAKKGLLGLMTAGAILVGSAGLSGCRTGADQRYLSGQTNYPQYLAERKAESDYNDGLALSLLGGLIGARGAQIGNPGAVVFGRALSNHGAAQASSSDVVVNNYIPNQTVAQYNPAPSGNSSVNVSLFQPSTPEPLVLRKESEILGRVVAVVSNYCKDFNGNGALDWPEDYGGLDRVYLPSEGITLSIASSKSADNLRIDLLNSKGTLIDSINGKGRYISKKCEGLAEETYGGTFYVGEQFLGKLEFMVSNNKWEVVKK